MIHARARRCDLSSLETNPAFATVSLEAKDLIRKLIVVNPAARLDVRGVRKHCWLARHHQILEDLYRRACDGWQPTCESREWIEEKDFGEDARSSVKQRGRLENNFGQNNSYRQQPYYWQKQQHVPMTVIEEEENLGVEDSMGRIRLRSAYGEEAARSSYPLQRREAEGINRGNGKGKQTPEGVGWGGGESVGHDMENGRLRRDLTSY